MSTVPLPPHVFDPDWSRLDEDGAQQAPLPEPKSAPVDLIVRSQVDRCAQPDPVVWRREWDGDVSDLGHWVYVEDANERDEPLSRWQPLYAAPEPAEQKASQADSRPDSVYSTERAVSELTDAQALRDVLLRNGFVECDIAACNCGSWHARYGYPERFREFVEALEEHGIDMNGKTPLTALRDALIASRLSQADSRSNQQGEGRCARALTEEMLMLDIDGDLPLSDELCEVWLDAQNAAEDCMPIYLHGHSEWCIRVQAACKVLIERLPDLHRRAAVEALKSDEGDLGVTLRGGAKTTGGR